MNCSWLRTAMTLTIGSSASFRAALSCCAQERAVGLAPAFISGRSTVGTSRLAARLLPKSIRPCGRTALRTRAARPARTMPIQWPPGCAAKISTAALSHCSIHRSRRRSERAHKSRAGFWASRDVDVSEMDSPNSYRALPKAQRFQRYISTPDSLAHPRGLPKVRIFQAK